MTRIRRIRSPNANPSAGTKGIPSAIVGAKSIIDGKYLYVLNSASKDIGAYSVAADGTLSNIQFAGGLPAGAAGMATD